MKLLQGARAVVLLLAFTLKISIALMLFIQTCQ